tara:strand:- start:60 stop:203 length:144 start_codon:yes stop_codon:yes gene_type:complete
MLAASILSLLAGFVVGYFGYDYLHPEEEHIVITQKGIDYLNNSDHDS